MNAEAEHPRLRPRPLEQASGVRLALKQQAVPVITQAGLPRDADVAASKEQSAALSTGLDVLPDTARRASVNITSTSDLGSQLTFLYLYSTIEPNLQQISSVTPLLHHIFHAMRGK